MKNFIHYIITIVIIAALWYVWPRSTEPTDPATTTPVYTAFTNARNISFEYPANVIFFDGSQSAGAHRFLITPRIELAAHEAYGIRVDVDNCDVIPCNDNLIEHARITHDPAFIEIAPDSPLSIGGRTWTKATITYSIGGDGDLYVTKIGSSIVAVDDMRAYPRNLMQPLLMKVLETININR